MRTSPARITVIVALLATLVVAIPAQAQMKGCAPGIKSEVPLLTVHGFRSDAETWQSGDPSMDKVLRKIEVISIQDGFDYKPYHMRWVTDENIGPRLARRIACIAQSSREEGGKGEVIVIGHSMGGLATQFAANQTVNGRRVADDIGLAIPIGTPFAGSQLADWTMTLARAYCSAQHITLVGGKTIRGNPNKCEAMLDTYTAIGGLRQDSAKLRELPPFPPDVPVHTIVGNVQEAKFNIFGVELKPLNSDLVVATDSATKGNAHPSHGGGKSTVDCVSVWPIPGFSDASCEHSRLLTDKNVQTRVVDAITQYLRRAKLDEGSAKFIGEWHGGNDTLTFNEDGTGKQVVYYGLCYFNSSNKDLCQVHVDFTWQPTNGGLALTIQSVKTVALTEAGGTLPAPADSEIDLSKFEQPGTKITMTTEFHGPGFLILDPKGNQPMYAGNYCNYDLPVSPGFQPLCGH